MPYDRRPFTERFWSKVQKTDYCWLWTGHRLPKGYGSGIRNKNVRMTAHRTSWFIHYGEIPKGLWVLHKCDNPSCVRPDHLYLGTSEDNIQDMTQKGRRRNGASKGILNGSAKLSEEDVKFIRKNYKRSDRWHKSQWDRSALAKRYNVSYITIYRILRGSMWKHI